MDHIASFRATARMRGSKHSEGFVTTLAAELEQERPSPPHTEAALTVVIGVSSRGLPVASSSLSLPDFTEKLQSLRLRSRSAAEFLTTRADCLEEEAFQAFLWATSGRPSPQVCPPVLGP